MQRAIVLALYIVFFAFIHSLTAARFFKEAVYRFIDPGKYRFLYTLVSVLTVLPLLYLWFWGRASSLLIYQIDFPYTLISIAMVISGSALALNSLILIDPLSFIGLKRVLKVKAEDKGLITKGAYRITRHPLYLGGMLVLWSNPSMRLVDFVASILFSLYLLIGAGFEERKLEEEFGEEYRNYKKKVSMFIPFKWFLDLIRF